MSKFVNVGIHLKEKLLLVLPNITGITRLSSKCSSIKHLLVGALSFHSLLANSDQYFSNITYSKTIYLKSFIDESGYSRLFLIRCN